MKKILIISTCIIFILALICRWYYVNFYLPDKSMAFCRDVKIGVSVSEVYSVLGDPVVSKKEYVGDRLFYPVRSYYASFGSMPENSFLIQSGLVVEKKCDETNLR